MTTSDSQNEKQLSCPPATKLAQQLQITPPVLTPEFIAECRRQSLLAAQSDALDPTIDSFTEAAFTETWLEIEKMEQEALRKKAAL